MSDKYILDGPDGRTPIRCNDLITWARWLEQSERHVAESIQGDVRVSTVFLGLDHGFGGRRHLFETMVFVAGADAGCERYATWDEAEAGHARWVAKVFKATPILVMPTTGDERWT